MLEYGEEFAAVFSAVNVDVVEVYVSFVGFQRYFLPETLAQGGFACSYFACNDDSLRHFVWNGQQEIEELHE